MTQWHENLLRLVRRIDELMPAEQPVNGMYFDYEEFKAHQRKLDAVVAKIVEEEDGRHSRSSGAEILRLCGVQASCTNGPSGLLRNWQNAALRKLGTIVTEENCPGHVASRADPKVCDRCGIHIDSLRPDDGFNPHGSGPVPIEPREV